MTNHPITDMSELKDNNASRQFATLTKEQGRTDSQPFKYQTDNPG